MNAVVALSVLICVPLSGAGRTESPPFVEVGVDQVQRQENLITLHVVVKNRGPDPVFLETDFFNYYKEPHTVYVQQLSSAGSWIFVGPSIDVPPERLIKLNAGDSLRHTVYLIDPYTGPRGGTRPGVPLGGRMHRVVVEYYLSERDWQTYRGYIAKSHGRGKKPPIEPKIAVSQTFEIPGVG
ncbi:MAG: hypothetical protein ABSE93_00855 [Terriglobia bacterium]|jgi:hypothetical protein